MVMDTDVVCVFPKFDSDDEREAQEAQVALSHKIHSQSIKKSKKNQSRMPRTVGLRTVTEMTDNLTRAGLDPSRIQERAEALAKVAGAKRKRADESAMDVEDEGEWSDEDGMDVDGAEKTPTKRTKGNSGAVMAVSRRAPKTDRRFAGMRDEAVSSRLFPCRLNGFSCVIIASKQSRQAA